ncbi:MAG: hypothetical protein ACKO34_05325 [Vampirovibrionales bacterium]
MSLQNRFQKASVFGVLSLLLLGQTLAWVALSLEADAARRSGGFSSRSYSRPSSFSSSRSSSSPSRFRVLSPTQSQQRFATTPKSNVVPMNRPNTNVNDPNRDVPMANRTQPTATPQGGSGMSNFVGTAVSAAVGSAVGTGIANSMTNHGNNNGNNNANGGTGAVAPPAEGMDANANMAEPNTTAPAQPVTPPPAPQDPMAGMVSFFWNVLTIGFQLVLIVLLGSLGLKFFKKINAPKQP